MDYSDRQKKKSPAQWLTLDRIPQAGVFDAALWGRDASSRRSRELTPLYAQRLVAPRASSEFGSHPFWEVVYVFRGTGTMVGGSAGMSVPMRAGSAVLIPPGVPHHEDAPREIDTLWVGLRGERTAALSGKQMLVVTGDELAGVAEQLWLRGRIAQHSAGTAGAELDGLALTLFAKLLRLLRAGGTQSPDEDMVEHAVRYLHQHLAEPISVASLAARFECSEGHFYRTFKQRTGSTPVQYLTHIRIETATQLMRESRLPISRIAALVGFPDALYFSRVYRNTTGRSPRETTRQMRPTPRAR